MATLRSTVYLVDPETHQTVVLEAGSSPEPRLAALVTNPSAWEDGKLPDSGDTKKSSASSDEDGGDTKQAARKTAARKPARGRNAADEGDSGN